MAYRQILTVLLFLVTSVPLLAQHYQPYDKPLKTSVVNLGWSQYLMPHNRMRIQLTCSYYSNFIVKELNDPGLKGSKVVVAPVKSAQAPECDQRRIHGDHQLSWGDSYFGGVKGSLVFLTNLDGTAGGMAFTMFDSMTGMKVFQDEAAFRHLSGERTELRFIDAADGKFKLRYLRVFVGECSVPKEGNACWNKISQKAGFHDALMPVCKDSVPPDGAPSAIGYPVEVMFLPKPSVRVLGNPTKCWPQL